MERYGGQWLPEESIRQGGRVVVQRKHNTVDEILRSGLLSHSEIANYLVFANIRNPYDRWVTYYQRYAGTWIDGYEAHVNRRLTKKTPSKEVRGALEGRVRAHELEMERHRKRQRIIRLVGFNPWMTATLLRWYRQGRKVGSSEPLLPYAFPMLGGVDVVIRQEQLEEGLNHILRMVGITDHVSLIRKNVTEGKRRYEDYWWAPTRRLAETMLGQLPERFGYQFEGLTSTTPTVELGSSSARNGWRARADL